MPAQLSKFVWNVHFTALWYLGGSVAIILSKYVLTKVTDATKINSKCSYAYVDELLIVYWTAGDLERQLILMML